MKAPEHRTKVAAVPATSQRKNEFGSQLLRHKRVKWNGSSQDGLPLPWDGVWPTTKVTNNVRITSESAKTKFD